MHETTKFLWRCGNIASDLVNTEVIRRVQRLDVLSTTDDYSDWLQTVQVDIPFGRLFARAITIIQNWR